MYICLVCGETKIPENELSMSEISKQLPYKCPYCNEDMVFDCKPVRIMIGNNSYSKPLISDSLAIHPGQKKEHEQLFPNVGVLPDGRLRFDDYKSHNDYLEQTGFYKQPQRIRRLKSNG